MLFRSAIDTRRIRFDDGREELWPIAAILVRIGEQECPSLALIGRPGGPALLGAVTLEELSLGVDPSGTRLIPTTSYLVSPTSVTEGLPLSEAS